METWQHDNVRGQLNPISYERPQPEWQGTSYIQNPAQDLSQTPCLNPLSHSETYQALSYGNERSQLIPIWYERPHPEWQGARYIQNSMQDLSQTLVSNPLSHSETYQSLWYAPSYQTSHESPCHVSQLPPNQAMYPPPCCSASYDTSHSLSYDTSHPSYEACHPISFPAANRFSNSSASNTTYLASLLRENLTISSVAEPEPNLATNQVPYCTPQSEAHANGSGPARHSWRAAHSSQYVNPYGVPARNSVMTVPTTYACQHRGVGSAAVCPILSSERQTFSCLYVSYIRGEPLHVTYNWLISMFERYPGFRDLHMTPGYLGAVVGFDTDYQTAIVQRALNGFWTFSKYKLSVQFVDSRIYKYMHLPGFNPEYFIQFEA